MKFSTKKEVVQFAAQKCRKFWTRLWEVGEQFSVCFKLCLLKFRLWGNKGRVKEGKG
jgi:hypothetical protein